MREQFPALKHLRHERDYSCTAACVRIVLAFYGREFPEHEVVELLETDETGTSFSKIEKVSELMFRAEIRSGNRDDLLAVSTTGVPVITAVHTLLLPTYPPPGGAHSVVVAAADAVSVTLFDPFRAVAPDIIPLEAFEAAWRRRRSLMARITAQP